MVQKSEVFCFQIVHSNWCVASCYWFELAVVISSCFNQNLQDPLKLPYDHFCVNGYPGVFPSEFRFLEPIFQLVFPVIFFCNQNQIEWAAYIYQEVRPSEAMTHRLSHAHYYLSNHSVIIKKLNLTYIVTKKNEIKKFTLLSPKMTSQCEMGLKLQK